MQFPRLYKKPAGFTPVHPRSVALITWATTPDFAAIQGINAGVRDPWPRAELACLLNDPRASTMVAKRGDATVAFVSYHLRQKALELVHFAVHKEHRRLGVGSQLFDCLDGKLGIHNLPRMTCAISEYDPETFAWFIGRGMRGCGVARDGIRPGVDSYIFEYWGRDGMVAGAGDCPKIVP